MLRLPVCCDDGHGHGGGGGAGSANRDPIVLHDDYGGGRGGHDGGHDVQPSENCN